MDYMLDIILQKSELTKSGLLEVSREWGGVKLSSSQTIYVTNSNIEFIEVKDLSYYNRILDFNINKDLICMHLKSDILYDFVLFANNHNGQKGENDLLIYLKNLIRLIKFYIILIREDELIKKKYKITNVGELESILLNSVNCDAPTDVLIYK